MIYTYKCKKCGDFDDFNTMDNCLDPAECPNCKAESPRIPSAWGGINIDSKMSVSRRTDIELSTISMKDHIKEIHKAKESKVLEGLKDSPSTNFK